jgi:hypothetical protein
MDLSVVPIECRGALCIRELESHALQPQDPTPTRLMMASNAGVRHLVETSLTGLAQGARTLGVRVVAPVCGALRALTMGTLDPVWPASATDGFNTLGVVHARLKVDHDASMAHRCVCDKCPRSGRSAASTESLSTPWNPY